LAKESRLYIYSDAAKDNTVVDDVNAVRCYIHSIKGFAEIEIVEREQNWGLARNIIDGVTTQVNKYGKVIVLEDDLIVSPYFLQFMNDALNMYKDEEKVGHIQACDFTKDRCLPDTFLIKWTGSWGWATWDRAWKLFNPDGLALLKELEDKKRIKEFDFNGHYGYTRMLRRQTEGLNNSWAIRWNASLFLKDILSLNVGKSLVLNTGFDGSGTNCGGGGLYSSDLWMKPLPVIKIAPIEENKAARKAYEHYYFKTNNFFAKAFRRIKRTLKGDFGA
jgi:GR25 family glycosyltransferase involved in LPS biosynthesis